MDAPQPNDLPSLPARPVPSGIALPTPPGGDLALAPSAGGSTDAMGLLKALRRRWVQATSLGLLAAVIIGPLVGWLFPDAKYTAQAFVQVKLKQPTIFGARADQTNDPTVERNNIKTIAKSPPVLRNALNAPEVQALSLIKVMSKDKDLNGLIDWLMDNLQVSFQNESDYLKIGLSGEKPIELAAIVNKVADMFVKEVNGQDSAQQQGSRTRIEILYKKYTKELEQKREDVENLVKDLQGSNPDEISIGRQYMITQLNGYESARLDVEREMAQVQSQLEILKVGKTDVPAVRAAAKDPSQPPPSAVEDLARRDAKVETIAKELQKARDNYESMKRVVRKQASDPALRKAREVMARAQADYDNALSVARERVRLALQQGTSPAALASNVPAAGRMREQSAEQLQAQLGMLEKSLAFYEERVSSLRAAITKSGTTSFALEIARQDFAITQEFARKIGAEREKLAVEADAQDRVKVYSPAQPPSAKDTLRKAKMGVMAGVGSFFAVLMGIAFWESRARRIDTADEVVNGLGIRIVGALPPLPSRLRSGQAGLPDRRWRSMLVESIDATRTMLLHASRAEGVRTVMVTSAVKGEGKTSLASHLATSLARSGRRTLLIDGDLRSPAVHRLFDQASEPGLCELLRGELSIEEALRETHAENLHLIAAGRCDLAALQALARDDLRMLLAAIREDYDFIVVDSAPVLPVADSLLIGQVVDAVVFSVLRDVSRLPAVNEARERLAGVGVRVLGAVVAGVPNGTYASDYASYATPTT